MHQNKNLIKRNNKMALTLFHECAAKKIMKKYYKKGTLKITLNKIKLFEVLLLKIKLFASYQTFLLFFPQ